MHAAQQTQHKLPFLKLFAVLVLFLRQLVPVFELPIIELPFFRLPLIALRQPFRFFARTQRPFRLQQEQYARFRRYPADAAGDHKLPEAEPRSDNARKAAAGKSADGLSHLRTAAPELLLRPAS